MKMMGRLVLVGVCTLLLALSGCAGPKGQKAKEKSAEVSCDVCVMVAEYGGLVKLAGAVVADRVKEIEVQLGSADVIDGLALACDFRNLVVDRRIEAGRIENIDECDVKRRSPDE